MSSYLRDSTPSRSRQSLPLISTAMMSIEYVLWLNKHPQVQCSCLIHNVVAAWFESPTKSEETGAQQPSTKANGATQPSIKATNWCNTAKHLATNYQKPIKKLPQPSNKLPNCRSASRKSADQGLCHQDQQDHRQKNQDSVKKANKIIVNKSNE